MGSTTSVTAAARRSFRAQSKARCCRASWKAMAFTRCCCAPEKALTRTSATAATDSSSVLSSSSRLLLPMQEERSVRAALRVGSAADDAAPRARLEPAPTGVLSDAPNMAPVARGQSDAPRQPLHAVRRLRRR